MLAMGEGQRVCSQDMQGEQPIVDFLTQLRRYRGTLSGTNQALLDALVTAAIGRIPRSPLSGRSAALWHSYAVGPHRRHLSSAGCSDGGDEGWRATPWGQAYEARWGC